MNVSKQKYLLNLVSWLVSVYDHIISNFSYNKNIFLHFFFMTLEVLDNWLILICFQFQLTTAANYIQSD